MPIAGCSRISQPASQILSARDLYCRDGRHWQSTETKLSGNTSVIFACFHDNKCRPQIEAATLANVATSLPESNSALASRSALASGERTEEAPDDA